MYIKNNNYTPVPMKNYCNTQYTVYYRSNSVNIFGGMFDIWSNIMYLYIVFKLKYYARLIANFGNPSQSFFKCIPTIQYLFNIIIPRVKIMVSKY